MQLGGVTNDDCESNNASNIYVNIGTPFDITIWPAYVYLTSLSKMIRSKVGVHLVSRVMGELILPFSLFSRFYLKKLNITPVIVTRNAQH